MTDIKILHCPSCGAPLKFNESARTTTCTYCNSQVILPESLRSVSRRVEAVNGIEPELLGDIYLMLANGQKITAIQRVREATGLGLGESKALVDRLEQETQPATQAHSLDGEPAPHQKTRRARLGCLVLGMIVLILLVLPILLVFLLADEGLFDATMRHWDAALASALPSSPIPYPLT